MENLNYWQRLKKLKLYSLLRRREIKVSLRYSRYIADLNRAFGPIKSVQFADDTTVYHSHQDTDELVRQLNNQLIVVDSWLCANRLSLNIEKTSYMIISNDNADNVDLKIRNCSLNRVYSAKFLGITLDDKLNFKEHVSNISKKISSSIGAIYRVKPYVPPFIIYKLYYSLVYSHLTYAIITWGKSNLGNIHIVSKLQEKALKLLPGDLESTFKNNNIMKFESIYKYFVCLKFFKSEKDHNHKYLCDIIQNLKPDHNYSTRFSSSDNYNVPHFNFSKYKSSYLYNAISIWNNLPIELKQENYYNKFKNKLKKHLLLNQ